jgi:ethanolamine phosphate phosphodiesterase
MIQGRSTPPRLATHRAYAVHRLGMVEWFSPERYTRYKSHFGELNYQVKLANHTLVFIDAPGLADEENKLVSAGKSLETWKPTPGGALEFISKFEKGWLA